MFEFCLLAIVLASGTADDQPDVATLIGRLGASSFEARVAAYKALESLGDAALPALRAAADTSNARVQARVRVLLDSIGRRVEADRFARSTMIRLNFRNRPLGEVVDVLNERHNLGLSLRLGPEPRRGMMIVDPNQPKRQKELKDRKITLEAAQPLPFWEAIDRLCKTGALRYGLSVSSRTGFGTSQDFLVLMADRFGRGPVSDSGPFRVQITGVHSVFERDFTIDPDLARPGTKSPGVGDLTVPLAVLPEPGLMLHQNGAVIVTEATDDRGRSLLPTTPAGSALGQTNRSSQLMTGHASIQVNASLKVPEPPGTVIRRLRGKVPVIAVARGSDPIVIPLKGEGPREQSFSTRDMTLLVDEVSIAPGAQASVRVTIRVNRGDLAATPKRADPRRPDFAAFDRNRLLEHLQLHDSAGRPLDHSVGESTRGADGHGFYDRYRLIVSPVLDDGPAEGRRNGKTSIPAELRYYGFVQMETEVPFDFRDIPMP